MQLTRWVVITGAPCSGKTSVIRELERRGYPVCHEVARALIDDALNQGLALHEIKADELSFEQRILQKKIIEESALDAKTRVFLDRAIPDSIAYFKNAGLAVHAPLAAGRLYRYEKIFLFEPLQFEKDRVRTEDNQTAMRLDRLLWETYNALGYDVMRVPVMPITKRTDWLLALLAA